RRPPYFDGMTREPGTVDDFSGARCLVRVGDSVTTDHISPAGSISPDSPAGRYLVEHGVERKDFNSYGSRRGNHEVMVRGTFANVRLRNLLVPGSEGTWTAHLPDGEEMTIYDASLGLTGRELYAIEGVENAEAHEVTVRADGKTFTARVRLDTPREREYLRHGGILRYVLRRLAA